MIESFKYLIFITKTTRASPFEEGLLKVEQLFMFFSLNILCTFYPP